jgi:outer membrane protein
MLVVVSMLPLPAGAQGLAQLYRAALEGNPMLRSRAYDVDRARAESDGARSRLLPQVLMLSALSRNQYDDATTFGNRSYAGKRTSLILRQTLYDQPSRSRWESTQATVVQSDQELVLTRLGLFYEVLDRYLEVLTAQDELEWMAAESQAATRQVDRLRAMRERQMAKVTDLAEAEAYAQSLVTRAIDAQNHQSVALARLTELCGVAVAQVSSLSRTSFDAVPGTQQAWVDHALRSYPRLLALAEAVEAARRLYESSRSEHLPQLTATMSYTYSDQGFDNRRQPPYHVAAVGVELRIPFYEGGRVDALTRLPLGDPRKGAGGAGRVVDMPRRWSAATPDRRRAGQGRQAGVRRQGREHADGRDRAGPRDSRDAHLPRGELRPGEAGGARATGEEAAIACANDNAYGLSAAVFGGDIARALQVARASSRASATSTARPCTTRRRCLSAASRAAAGPLRRQGRHRGLHRTALDHDADDAAALSFL